MSESFLGEIRMFAGSFAPAYWAYCDGQKMYIDQNVALYSLLDTYYGGDGRSDFLLPDLRGRVPLHQGSGVALTTRSMGARFGTETEILSKEQIPPHNHPMQVSANAAMTSSPNSTVIASRQGGDTLFGSAVDGRMADLNSDVVASVGEAMPHENRMPYLALSFIICLQGTYPPRS